MASPTSELQNAENVEHSNPIHPTTPPSLSHLATLSPPSLTRAWHSAPHPKLPLVATCASDKEVRIYSLTSFTQLSSISGGHKRSVRSCDWKPGLPQRQSTLATASFDASIGVWRRQEEEEGGRYDGVGDDAPKRSANTDGNEALDGGGIDVAAATKARVDQSDEDEEWRFALVLDGHDSEVKSVSWSAGGNLLATCSRDKSVWIWEEVGEDDFETIAVLQEHSGDVKHVAWHPAEELLASASYDDEVRLWREDLDDWDCVAVLAGHTSTVWMVAWEGLALVPPWDRDQRQDEWKNNAKAEQERRDAWLFRRKEAGPRLATCSDDGTVRIWRRLPRTGARTQQNSLSILRTGSNAENWVEEVRLPRAHVRSIYAVAWSANTGRLVTTGGDGRIVVYEERWRTPEAGSRVDQEEVASRAPGSQSDSNDLLSGSRSEPAQVTERSADGDKDESTSSPRNVETPVTNDIRGGPSQDPPIPSESQGQFDKPDKLSNLDDETQWVIVATQEGAHGVFEVNHATWAKRADRPRRKIKTPLCKDGDEVDEEVIVSTGDDGEVKVWTIDI